jgi:hypothetical protein
VGRCHVLELEFAEHRAYVQSDYLFVALEGGWPHRIGHTVSQPLIQVLAELEVIRVEDEAPGCIAPCVGQLPLYPLVLPAADRLALRTFRRLYRVGGM